MPRGRPPLSTAQHKAQGTARSNRHSDRVDTQYKPGAPPIPDRLGDQGARLWCEHIRTTPAECVTEIDFAGLEEACRVYQRLHEYSLLLADDPLELKIAKAHDNLTTKFLAYMARFGWSPVDRARLKSPGGAKQNENPMAALLKVRAAE